MDAWSTIIGGAIALAGSFGTAYMNRKSEEKKQKLQFEYSNFQKVLEDRKSSYRKIIEELYKAVKMVRLNQPHDDAWDPVNKESFESTNEALTKEVPFINEKAERALRLFLDILSETVLWDAEMDEHSYSPVTKDKMIRRAYVELKYLYDQIAIFSRSQIDLKKEVPLILSKVALLEVCRFITQERFEGLNFPNQDIIKLDGSQSPMDILQSAENNSGMFKKELASFLNFLKTNPLKLRSEEYFMSEIANIEKLLIYL